MATVVLGSLIVGVIAVGSWLSATSSSDPSADAASATGSADIGLDRAPLGIAVAGLLVLGAVAAIVIDRRRRRATAGGPTDPMAIAAPGRHARPDPMEPDIADSATTSESINDPAGLLPAPRRTTADPAVAPTPTVDLVFPFASNLAASLRDELFTHRSVST